MIPEASFYDRALRRIVLLAVVLGSAAGVFITVRSGWRDGLGFAAGAAVSIINFSWWKRVAGFRPASAVFLGMRYLILGAVCFVIIKFLGVNYLALLAGLLTAVAAVLAESVYQLLFTR